MSLYQSRLIAFDFLTHMSSIFEKKSQPTSNVSRPLLVLGRTLSSSLSFCVAILYFLDDQATSAQDNDGQTTVGTGARQTKLT